jgi:hypothetical protein
MPKRTAIETTTSRGEFKIGKFTLNAPKGIRNNKGYAR